MNVVQINLGKVDNTCFVVMPFNALYQTEYENIIKPALTELNIICVRGDEIYARQRIMDDIWHSIRRCRFVIAELTGRNPNVLYEVGLAHAIGKPVIVLTRNGDDVPFDLKDLRYIFYDVNDPFWGENLKISIQSLVKKVLENPEMENYLEDITKPNPLVFPEIKKIKVEKTKNKFFDISGNWIGSFDLNGYHGITVNIIQDGSALTANAIITVSLERDADVVQQLMSGTFDETKAVFKGVNYSFVVRKNLEDYVLDTFTFTEFQHNFISGFVTDSQNPKLQGEIRLTRN